MSPVLAVSGASNFENTASSDPNFLSWTVSLSEPATEAVTVSYRFLSGTALVGSSSSGPDAYGTLESFVTFAAGETSKTVSIRIRSDTVDETDEAVILEVFSAEGAALAGGAPVLRSTGWILDDDGTGDDLALFVSRPVVVEGDAGQTQAVFEVSLSRPAPTAFTADYATVDGSATAGEDYAATSGTLSFVAGQTSVSVVVPIFGDTDIEPIELFSLSFDTPALVEAVSIGAAEILDDDTGGSVQPTVNVSGTSNFENTASSDPNFLSWTVSLSEPATEAVTVSYRFLSGTALVGSSSSGPDAYGTLESFVTFAAGETSKTVSIRIRSDTVDETDEAVILEVFSAEGAALAGGAPVLRSTGWILDDDGTGNDLALFVSRPLVVEGDAGQTQAVFEVSLSRPAPTAFTVDYATVDGSATAGEDYAATSGTLSFAAGQTSASVTVPVFGDTDIEPTELFSLSFDTPALVEAVSIGAAEILDDDTGGSVQPTVNVSGTSNFENTASSDPNFLSWTVSLSEPATEAVTVSYRFLSGTALVGSSSSGPDAYGTLESFVTFAAGETSKTVSIRIRSDTVDETDEAVILEVFSAEGAALAGGAPVLRSTGWILDDDGTGNDLALFVSRPLVVEGDAGQTQAVFEVSLSRPAPTAFTVDYATVDGSATAGEDYAATSGTLSFVAGQTSASVTVPVFGDTDIEPTELFSLSFDTPALVEAVSIGAAEILDDDTGGSVQPTVNVSGTSNFENTASSDPNFLSWTVSLSEPATEAVTVSYRFLSGTALVGSSSSGPDAYGTLESFVTFAAGETSKTVSIRIRSDTVDETDEAVILEVFSAEGAALAGGAPVLRSTGWILDDDGTGNDLALFVSRPLVVEGDAGQTQAVFEVSLSRPAPTAFTVDYATVDGSATAGEDYAATSGTLSFAAGQTSVSVVVPIFGDTDIEPIELFSLSFDTPALVEAVSIGAAEILDDDTGGSVQPTVNVSGTSNFENTASSDPNFLSWTVSLSEPATEAVTVSYRFLSGTALVGSSSSGPDAYGTLESFVTFAAGETSKTVSIRIRSDTVDETDEAVILEVFSAEGAALAGGAPVLRSTGWILDDDGTGNDLALFVSRPLVVEGDAGQTQAVFEVSLSRPAPTAFTVDYATVDGSATAGEDYAATSGTLSFVAGQTSASVTVPIFGDTDIEPTELFSLSFDFQGTEVSFDVPIENDDFQNAPVGVADSYTAVAGATLSISTGVGVLANDTDVEGQVLTAELVNEPSQGTLTFNPNGSFNYVASPGGSGVDEFTYRASDGIDFSAETSVQITFEDDTSGTPGEFAFDISVPETLAPGTSGAAQVTYERGIPEDTPLNIEAALFFVSGEAALVRDPLTSAFDDQVFLLSYGDGIDDIAIGESGVAEFEVQGTAGPRAGYTVNASIIDFDAVIDWGASVDLLRPSGVSDEAWAILTDLLIDQLGTTGADFANALADYGKKLQSFGLNGESASAALAFLTEVVGDFGSIASRTEQGAMGKGWSSVADIGLDIDDDTIILQGLSELSILRNLDPGSAAFFSISESGSRGVTLAGSVIADVPTTSVEFIATEIGTFANTGLTDAELIATQDGFTVEFSDGAQMLLDATGSLLKLVEADGQETSAIRDGDGNLTALVGPQGASLTFTRDTDGRVDSVTDEDGNSVALTYDAAGRLVSTTDDAGTASFTYDAASNLSSAKPAGVDAADITYDAELRLASIDYAGGLQSETFTYDGVGGVTITDGEGRSTTVDYLPGGAVGRVTDGEGNVSSLIFDADGNLIGLRAPDGTETTFTFDDLGRITILTDAKDATVEFGYEGASDAPSIFTDASDATRTFTYDAGGRIVEAEWDDGTSLEFAYDANGNLTMSENRRGEAIDYTYDANGRLLSQSDGSSGAVTYTYDAQGRLIQAVDDRGTTSFEYDSADRITQITYPEGRSLAYTYNEAGLRTSMTDQSGDALFYEYDNLGRLIGLDDEDGGIVDYNYDTAGNLILEENGNGTTSSFAYDDANRLTEIVNAQANGTVNSFYRYTYDAAGQRVEMESHDGTWTYGYDAIGQLTSAEFVSINPLIADKSLVYEYDGAGNRTRVVEDGRDTLYTANALNQYTSVGDATFTYDDDGNMVSKTDPSGTTSYEYDLNNRLVKVIEADGTVHEHEYDVLENRVATTTDGERTEFLLDPFGFGNVIGDYSADGNRSAEFVYGLGLTGAKIHGVTGFYDANGVGSVSTITSNSGAILNSYAYDPFGVEIGEIETFANRFEFNGLWGVQQDFEDSISMRFRNYDPNLGNFVTEDPLWLDGDTLNLTRFAFNNPVSFFDPTGLLASYDIGNGEPYPTGPEMGGAGGPRIGPSIYTRPGGGGVIPDHREHVGDLAGPLLTTISLGFGGLQFATGKALFGFLTGAGARLFGASKFLPFLTGDTPVDEGQNNDADGGASEKDPWIRTFDGTGSFFNAYGEFVLARSTDGDFEVQTRQLPVYWFTDDPSEHITSNYSAATRIGDDKVEIQWVENRVANVLVNGNEVSLEVGEAIAVGDGTVQRSGGTTYVVSNGLGDGMVVRVGSIYLNVYPFVDPSRAGEVEGVLGNNDGDRSNDFALPDGTVLPSNISFQELYTTFADAWRVTDATSLFTYLVDRSTADFTDLDFPPGVLRIEDFDPDVVAAAEAAALAAGLVPGTWQFETTVFDIALTGDVTFAETAAAAPEFVYFEIDGSRRETEVADVDLPPQIADDLTSSVEEDGIVTIDVIAGATDPEGGELTLLSGSDLNGGIVSIEDRLLVFSPNADFNGETELSFLLGDEVGNQTTGIVSVLVSSVEDLPVADNDLSSTEENVPVDIDVLSNDTDADGDTLMVVSVGTAANGTTSVNRDGTVRYNPALGFDGSDDFTYTVSDGNGGTDTAVVTVTVVNDGVLLGTDDDDVLNGAGLFTNLFGLAGNDTLNGGTGAATMDGGTGNDQFFVDDAGDVVIEAVGEGTDLLRTLVDFTLPDNVENGSTLGTGNVAITGNTLPNFITGNGGANTLRGEGGADRLIALDGDDVLEGGPGNDILEGGLGANLFGVSVNHGNDQIIGFQLGVDRLDFRNTGMNLADLVILSSGGEALIQFDDQAGGIGSFRLIDIDPETLERDDFLFDPAAPRPPGAGGLTFGTSGADNLAATNGDDDVVGLAGNDILNGRAGADTMVGGFGNDRYFLDNAGDLAIEQQFQGTDQMDATFSFTLAEHIENGAVLGGGAVDITGNGLNNFITGSALSNVLRGEDGRDRLIGFDGDDTLIGGLENDVLEGGAGADVFVFAPEDGLNLITDFEVGVDLIDVTALNVSFADLTIVDGLLGARVIFDLTPGSVDLVTVQGVAAADLRLTSFLGAPNDPIVGTEGNDVLFGTIENDELQGLGGADLVDGRAGADTMLGGLGDDRYFVDDAGDVVTELPGEGTDLVSSFIDFTLPDNVENGSALGTDDVDLTGNALANALTGNAGANTLSGEDGPDNLQGLAGTDTIDGGPGTDVLRGGADADIFLFETGDGQGAGDQILDFELGVDTIDLSATGLSFADLTIQNVGTNTTIAYGTDTITVFNVSAAQLDQDQFDFA